jgi:hypothetical protein
MCAGEGGIGIFMVGKRAVCEDGDGSMKMSNSSTVGSAERSISRKGKECDETVEGEGGGEDIIVYRRGILGQCCTVLMVGRTACERKFPGSRAFILIGAV